MSKRRALMVSGQYPCVRVGKLTAAMSNIGWEHDAISMRSPMQLNEVYRSVFYDPTMTIPEFVQKVADHPGELIHVHNEPNWPVQAIKEATDKPLIFNVHDIGSARPESIIHIDEEAAFALADAYVFISEEQRQFAIDMGFGPHMEGKHYTVLPNFVTSRVMIDKTPLPHIGGMVYAGGLQARGTPQAWRDLSPLADIMELHLYPGNSDVDYGINHGTVFEYPLLMHRLAQHDWGFCGVPEWNAQWAQAVPNKVFEYFAAGIPVIGFNCPLIKPLCDAGLGIYVDKLSDIPKAASVDPRPFKKKVMELRNQFTMEHNIGALGELYEAVLADVV